ncbi:hypothetical protein MANES_03G167050v8 [Manihot esculenta]|uniref:Uncharacterized protein n=1 Tax=Manihot esculenta TaxID=3983 RepID=A0ACB7I1G9_MANES|nr:hypothetical protein MANES_03G167050v8 [Manihot esculenta]
MADISRSSSSSATPSAPQRSRLQRRRPASLQIYPPVSSRWNAAIPLLSPLLTSPTVIAEMTSREEKQQPSQHRNQETDPEKADASFSFNKWDHPASPNCHEIETPSLAPKFCLACIDVECKGFSI